jgi:Holliday junction DNA helicase RuvA
MITRITGTLTRVLDEEVRLQVGGFEYAVQVPEFVRRAVQGSLGKELSFFTCHYFDGNPMQGRVVPRLIGFSSEADLEFFDLICTVDKVGTKKALKALVRPTQEIANAIQRQDAKWLTTLPGIGAATAEQMIASLRRKVTRFAVSLPSRAPAADGGADTGPVVVVDGNVVEDAYQALLGLGMSPIEARNRLDTVLTSGKTYKAVEDIITDAFQNKA